MLYNILSSLNSQLVGDSFFLINMHFLAAVNSDVKFKKWTFISHSTLAVHYVCIFDEDEIYI